MVLQCRNSCYKPDRKLDSSVQPFGEEKYEAKLKIKKQKKKPHTTKLCNYNFTIHWIRYQCYLQGERLLNMFPSMAGTLTHK